VRGGGARWWFEVVVPGGGARWRCEGAVRGAGVRRRPAGRAGGGTCRGVSFYRKIKSQEVIMLLEKDSAFLPGLRPNSSAHLRLVGISLAARGCTRRIKIRSAAWLRFQEVEREFRSRR
jgi:hypothetical protein